MFSLFADRHLTVTLPISVGSLKANIYNLARNPPVSEISLRNATSKCSDYLNIPEP